MIGLKLSTEMTRVSACSRYLCVDAGTVMLKVRVPDGELILLQDRTRRRQVRKLRDMPTDRVGH